MKEDNAKASLIYGIHPVIEALAAGETIEKIFVRQDNNHGRLGEIRGLARAAGIPVQQVPEIKIRKLGGTDQHQGVIARLSPVEYADLESLILSLQEQKVQPFLVMLDGVTDVRNMGAIARSAECLGAHGLIIPSQGAASVNAVAMKTSAGALLHLPVCRPAQLRDALLLLEAYEISTVAITEKASASLYEGDFTGSTCLILGSEEKGISAAILKRAHALYQIPMSGKISSLNVSAAASIAFAETARQRSSS